MKKIVVILLIALMVMPCFAKTFTEEEFYEVYDALYATNEMLKDRENIITDLNLQVKNLIDENSKLTEKLTDSLTMIDEMEKLLSESKKELERSAKKIETLNNQKIIAGCGVYAGNNALDDFSFGICGNIAYKLSLGYLMGSIGIFRDNSFIFGLSYSLLF